MEERLFEGCGQFGEGFLLIDGEMLRESLNAAIEEDFELRDLRPPRLDRALGERFGLIRHDQGRIRPQQAPHAFTDRTRADVRVEGKMLRRQFFDRVARFRVCVGCGENVRGLLTVLRGQKSHLALIPVQRGLDGLHQARARIGAQHESVDHDVDFVLLALRKGRKGIQFDDLAVQADADESLPLQLLKQRHQNIGSSSWKRRQHDEPRAFTECEDLFADLRGCAARELLAGFRIVRLTGHGVEHAQVIVDLRDGGDGAARIGRRIDLLDGDRG